jgi:hypothetical protein
MPMPRPRKSNPSPSPALSGYRDTCPFSGRPLEFVQTSAGWQVRGPGWVSTQFYRTKEGAQWDFSYNLGEPCAGVSNPNPKVEVRELEEPDTEIENKANSMKKFVENVAEEVVSG